MHSWYLILKLIFVKLVLCFRIQEGREERQRYKQAIKTFVPVEPDKDIFKDVMPADIGSFDNGDPNTTNIYLGNVNPHVREIILIVFDVH